MASSTPPVGVQPDVAVRVDEAGHEEAAIGDGVGVGDRLVGDEAVLVDPEVAFDAVGQDNGPHVQPHCHR